jgi:heparosan-N-sulfate-glucuronate 5-epimerase
MLPLSLNCLHLFFNCSHMINATPFLVRIGGNFLVIVLTAYAIVGSNNIVFVLASVDVETFTDENGIAIRDYGGIIGKVYNPLAVATGGLNYYDEYKENGDKQSKEYFLNTANWLVNQSIDKGQYSLWEYDFPWQNERLGWLAPPWYSALAQAEGINVLILAHDMTREKRFLDEAKKAFQAFLVKYEDGGVITEEGNNNESIFLHLTAKPGLEKEYVLNGHTNSLIFIWKYYEYTNDHIAKEVFDKGIRYLKENLWKYDFLGYWSYYDQMKKLATINYHRSHIYQLATLYEITGEPILKEYSDKFAQYDKKRGI